MTRDDGMAADGGCERHSRLTGLWFICFILLTTGFMKLVTLFWAKPLGLALLAPLTFLVLAIGVGLWRRQSWASWILLGVSILIAVGSGLSFARELASSPIQAMFSALGVVVGLSVVLYLLMRRKHFWPGVPKPGVRSRLFIGTATFALLLGGSIAVLLYREQSVAEFPRLKLKRKPVPPEKNGYVVLRQMTYKGLCSDSKSTEVAFEIPEPGTEEFRNWTQRAREVIDGSRSCLGKLNEAFTKWMIQKIGALEKVPGWEGNLHEHVGWGGKLFRDPTPLFKENHTINLVGRRYSRLLVMAKKGKFPVEHKPQGGVFGHGYGVGQWLRNPLGVILASLVQSEVELRAYFDALSRLRATKLLLRLGIFRRRTGGFPEKLTQLPDYSTENDRTDPFSGKRFIYEKEGAVVRLLSVGPDGRQDPEDEHQRKRDDIVVSADFGRIDPN